MTDYAPLRRTGDNHSRLSANPPGTRSDPDRISRAISRLPPRLRWATGAMRLTLREPADGLDRVRVRVQGMLRSKPPAVHRYEPDADWHRQLHERLGLGWPCTASPDFERLWLEVVEDVRLHGLSLGRNTYGGWDDADPGFARAIWCLMSHLRPAKVVETGVARGVTSRIILEAIERADTGHLWSIDLPAMDPTLHEEIGVAVPQTLSRRWTYITGTSRRRLPKLLSDIGPIGLFVHDSSHTERNILFELREAWPTIDNGAAVADDVQQSPGFARFAASLPGEATFVVEADDASAMFGIALKLDNCGQKPRFTAR